MVAAVAAVVVVVVAAAAVVVVVVAAAVVVVVVVVVAHAGPSAAARRPAWTLRLLRNEPMPSSSLQARHPRASGVSSLRLCGRGMTLALGPVPVRAE